MFSLDSKRVIISILCVLGLFGYVFTPTDAAAQQASFGYTVDGYDVELYVVEPTQEGDEEYYYGWIFNPDSGDNPYEPNHQCVDNPDGVYDVFGQETTFSCTGSNDVSIYTSGFDQLNILFEVADGEGNIILDTSKVIDVGPSVDESDRDGDGTLDRNDRCPDDPDNECEDGGGDGGDGDGGGGGDGSTEGLVNCGNPGADGVLQESEMCDYQALTGLVQQIINWLIGILVMVATLLFMYAGFLYLTAGGDGSQVDSAKEMFRNVAGGFLIVLLAFTIIATLVNLLTSEDWRDNWEQTIPIELSVGAEPNIHQS